MKPTLFSIKSASAIAVITVFIALIAIPSSASARSSVHIDLPHFSIGFHDDHYGKRYRKHHRKYYDSDRRYRKRHYQKKKRYYNRHYDNGYYDNNYYGGYSTYRPRRNYNNRRNNYCPTDTYSRYYYRNSDCYSHGDHYHCNG